MLTTCAKPGKRERGNASNEGHASHSKCVKMPVPGHVTIPQGPYGKRWEGKRQFGMTLVQSKKRLPNHQLVPCIYESKLIVATWDDGGAG